MDTIAPSTVSLLWTFLLKTSGYRCSGISLHLNILGKSPRVQLLGLRASLFLTLWGTSTQFSRFSVPVQIPTNSVRGFPFLSILSTFVVSCLVNFPHPHRCEVVSHCSFDLYFLEASDAEHFLMCMLAMSMSSSVRFLFMSFAHFIIELFVSLVLCLSSS